MAEKNFLDHPKLRISAPNPATKGKYATFSFGIWNSNPRFIVSTNDPAFANKENNFGRIQAAVEPPTMYAVIEAIKEISGSKESKKIVIQNFVNNKTDPKAPIHSSNLVIGKDETGCTYISVTDMNEKWPKIKFIFGAPDTRWHKIFHSNGTEWSKGEYSDLYAKAYVNLLSQVFSNLLVKDYVHQVYTPGGYGNKQGGQQSYSQPAAASTASFDDAF